MSRLWCGAVDGGDRAPKHNAGPPRPAEHRLRPPLLRVCTRSRAGPYYSNVCVGSVACVRVRREVTATTATRTTTTTRRRSTGPRQYPPRAARVINDLTNKCSTVREITRRYNIITRKAAASDRRRRRRAVLFYSCPSSIKFVFTYFDCLFNFFFKVFFCIPIFGVFFRKNFL